MKKKASLNNPQNELLQFEKLLVKNLGKSNGGSMPNLHKESYSSSSVIFDKPFSSNSNIYKKANNNISNLIQSSNNIIGKTSLYDNNNVLDTKQLKTNVDSIGILNTNNIKIFTTYFTNLSHKKELSFNNAFISISSYFSNWSEIFIKFFKQFLIEFEIPKCPEYIERLNILNYESIEKKNNSNENNIKNCIFSLYKWNYLFLNIMKFVEERETYTKKIVEHYESQNEHLQLLKEIINQKYGKDSAQSLIREYLNEKKQLMKIESEKILYSNLKNDELFDKKQYIEKRETETQTETKEYSDKSIETINIHRKTESIQTLLNGKEIEENLNSLSTMTSKVKSLELAHASSMNELSDLKEDYNKKQSELKTQMENKMALIQNEYKELKNSKSNLENELDFLSNNYDKLRKECESITSSNEKLCEWKNLNEKTLSENKKSMELLSEELKQKIEEIKNIQNEYEEYKKSQEAELETKIKEINDLNNKILNLDQGIRMQKIKETSLTEEIDIWKENEKKLKETYGDLHYSLLIAQEEIIKLQYKLEESDKKCKNYETKIKDLQSQLYTIVENPETEVNSSILMTDSIIEEKIAANNIKISILEEINDSYRKIQLEKVNTKSINLKEKIEKTRKSQELFENERLKKLLQKSKAYEEQMNNYLNNYTPPHPPERKRDIRSASSIITIESIDDESNYNGMSRNDEIRNHRSSSKTSIKNYPNKINSLDYENHKNNTSNNNGNNNNNNNNNNNTNSSYTENYFIKPSNSGNSNLSKNIVNNSNSNNHDNINISNKNKNHFPTLSKENDPKNTNNKIFWNAPKKNTKFNNIYPTTYTSSIKMAEIIYKNFPRPNNKFNTSNDNNKLKNNVSGSNKTPMIQKTTSLTSNNKTHSQNSTNVKTLNDIQTKYPPTKLSKYMIPSNIIKDSINKSSHVSIFNFNIEPLESNKKPNDTKITKSSTTKHLSFSDTTNSIYSKRKK